MGKIKKRKICIVTGSRADYAHLYWLLKEIANDPQLTLQLVVTGMHLSKVHGLTYKMIVKDGFSINTKINLLLYSNTEVGMTKSIGEGCKLFADAFQRLKPDMVVIFADRFEMLSAAIAAYVTKIPIAHIHGGETTQGAVDEAIRHSITKMAGLHFAATEVYRKRIIQLGEHPKSVFNAGSPSLEALRSQELLTRKELEASLGFDLTGRVAILTYHPVTLERETPQKQIENILRALAKFDLKVVFTKANADAHGDIINKRIEAFCRKDPARYKLFDFLGQKRYFSCLKHFDVMIGNSSSGLVEAPSFKLPVVNIGDRQKGRIRAGNVVDVGYSSDAIQRGIRCALSKGFKVRLKKLRNPYACLHREKTSCYIKERLKKFAANGNSLKKEFYDIR